MKRINTDNRAIDLFGPGKDGFKASVPGVSEATRLSADFMNGVQEAIARTIERSGGIPGDDLDQFTNSVLKLIQDGVAGVTFVHYGDLRAYSGDQKVVYVSGSLVTAEPSGIAGHFTRRDDLDPASTPDNGGTFIVGHYVWQRQYSGEILPVWFGMVTDWDGTEGTDNYTAIQGAIDAAAAAGGGVVKLMATPAGPAALCNTPLLVPSGVSVITPTREAFRLVKDSDTTRAVTIYAAPLVPGMYPPSALPTEANAIMILTGPGGRYSGRVSNLCLEGTFATPGDRESQKVEFGILSVGSVSDAVIEDNYVNWCRHAFIAPDVFLSRVINNRWGECLYGAGIGGTSCQYLGNYAVSCRDYGHYMRDLKYSLISSNGCDTLNRYDYYPDRNRLAQAYVFDGCFGLTIAGNGMETVLGRGYVFLGLRSSTVINNTATNIGSDYLGTEHIAVMYSNDVDQSNTIENNMGYDHHADGLLFSKVAGRAPDPTKHHNIYFEGKATVERVRFNNNIVRDALIGSVVEGGWLNNVNAPLSDYEEDTWVPVDASGAGLALTVTKATFKRTGKVVHAYFWITFPATASAASVLIGGLPYLADDSVYSSSIVDTNQGSITVARAKAGLAQFELLAPSSNTSFTNANFSGKLVLGTLTYFAKN